MMGKGFSDVTTRGREDFPIITMSGTHRNGANKMRTSHAQGVKKGSRKAALCHVARNYQALGSIPSFRSLSRHESFTQELKLPCPATALICSSSSSSKRMCFMVLPLRSNAFFCLSPCIGSYQYYNGNADGNYHSAVNQYHSTKTAKPRGALTPSGPLTTNVIESNEVAMSNRITPREGRAALSPNKFTWRFLALGATESTVIHITATAEHEARKQSPAGFVLIFAGRLPAQEVRHA